MTAEAKLLLALVVVGVLWVALVFRYGARIDDEAVDCAEDCESVNAWARAFDPCECVPYEEVRR